VKEYILGWVRLAGLRVRDKIFEKIDESPDKIKEIQIDEMWHFLKKNAKNYGLLKLSIQPPTEF
jgi:hypothetical protein